MTGGGSTPGFARGRRLRSTPALRRLTAQTRLSPADFVLPVFGTFLDFLELPVDVVVAMILSRNTLHRAATREATTVQGKVVSDETVSETKKG